MTVDVQRLLYPARHIGANDFLIFYKRNR